MRVPPLLHVLSSALISHFILFINLPVCLCGRRSEYLPDVAYVPDVVSVLLEGFPALTLLT